MLTYNDAYLEKEIIFLIKKKEGDFKMLIFLAIIVTVICYMIAIDKNKMEVHFIINKYRRLGEDQKIKYILETKELEFEVKKNVFDEIKPFNHYEFDYKGRLR